MSSSSIIHAGDAAVRLSLLDQTAAGMRAAEGRLRSWAASLQAVGARLAGVGTLLATPFVYATKAASDANETASKFAQVFGSQTQQAEAFVQQLARGVGRSRSEIREGLSSFQALFTGMNFDPSRARGMSESLQALAIDFASFHNTTDADAMEAFLSAISGQVRPLMRFGVNLHEAAVEQEVLRQRTAGVTAAGDEQAKVLARLALIQRAMGQQGAVGDAVRTADQFANRLRAATSAASEAAVAVGETFLDPLSRLLGVMTRGAFAAADWVREHRGLVLAVGSVAAAVPLAGFALLGLGTAVELSTFALGPLRSAVAVAGGALSALATLAAGVLTPIGLLAAGALALGGYLVTGTEAGRGALRALGGEFDGLRRAAQATWANLNPGSVMALLGEAARSLGRAFAWLRGQTLAFWAVIREPALDVLRGLLIGFGVAVGTWGAVVMAAWDGVKAAVVAGMEVLSAAASTLSTVFAPALAAAGEMLGHFGDEAAKIKSVQIGLLLGTAVALRVAIMGVTAAVGAAQLAFAGLYAAVMLPIRAFAMLEHVLDAIAMTARLTRAFAVVEAAAVSLGGVLAGGFAAAARVAAAAWGGLAAAGRAVVAAFALARAGAVLLYGAYQAGVFSSTAFTVALGLLRTAAVATWGALRALAVGTFSLEAALKLAIAALTTAVAWAESAVAALETMGFVFRALGVSGALLDGAMKALAFTMGALQAGIRVLTGYVSLAATLDKVMRGLGTAITAVSGAARGVFDAFMGLSGPWKALIAALGVGYGVLAMIDPELAGQVALYGGLAAAVYGFAVAGQKVAAAWRAMNLQAIIGGALTSAWAMVLKAWYAAAGAVQSAATGVVQAWGALVAGVKGAWAVGVSLALRGMALASYLASAAVAGARAVMTAASAAAVALAVTVRTLWASWTVLGVTLGLAAFGFAVIRTALLATLGAAVSTYVAVRALNLAGLVSQAVTLGVVGAWKVLSATLLSAKAFMLANAGVVGLLKVAYLGLWAVMTFGGATSVMGALGLAVSGLAAMFVYSSSKAALARQGWEGWGAQVGSVVESAKIGFGEVVEAIKNGDMEEALAAGTSALKAIWLQTVNFLQEQWLRFVHVLKSAWADIEDVMGVRLTDPFAATRRGSMGEGAMGDAARAAGGAGGAGGGAEGGFMSKALGVLGSGYRMTTHGLAILGAIVSGGDYHEVNRGEQMAEAARASGATAAVADARRRERDDELNREIAKLREESREIDRQHKAEADVRRLARDEREFWDAIWESLPDKARKADEVNTDETRKQATAGTFNAAAIAGFLGGGGPGETAAQRQVRLAEEQLVQQRAMNQVLAQLLAEARAGGGVGVA